MTQAQTVDALVDDLYDELIGLDPSNLTRAGQIEWQLRKLAGPHRTNWKIQIALVQALIQQGNASEALGIADKVWDGRFIIKGAQLYAYQNQLRNLGVYERASELLSTLLITKVIPESVFFRREVDLAWHTGNLPKLEEVIAGASDKSDSEFVRIWTALLERLECLGLKPHLQQHQAIIAARLDGLQVGISVEVYPGSDEVALGAELAQYMYVHGDYATRIRLEDQIYSDLEKFYGRLGLSLCEIWNVMTPVVMNVAERPLFAPVQKTTQENM